MVINRIGDFGLALAMFVCYDVFKSLDFATIFPLVPTMIHAKFYLLGFDFNGITTIAILLFIGAVGKSAQLGLHG
jgi:NADH:ubiquinone oxidoreductase subunit 5 (subunit L)/multisubunit Na+/H+ antiporter MnhA subunit